MKIKYEADMNETVISDHNQSFAAVIDEFYICNEKIFDTLIEKYSNLTDKNLVTIETSAIDGSVKIYFDSNSEDLYFGIGKYKLPRILFKVSWYGPSGAEECMVNKEIIKILGIDHQVYITDKIYIKGLEPIDERDERFVC